MLVKTVRVWFWGGFVWEKCDTELKLTGQEMSIISKFAGVE